MRELVTAGQVKRVPRDGEQSSWTAHHELENLAQQGY